jgi:hypothetical protein
MAAFIALAPPRPASVKAGDRLRHVDYGPVTVTRVRKSDGAVFVRDGDGIEGTVLREDLRLMPDTTTTRA